MALTRKQKSFIDAYLSTFNATEAARQAKYNGDDVTLASIGWENLRKPEIAQVISMRLSEMAMGADEVLHRLAAQARGNMGDFVRFADGRPTFDLETAAMLGKMGLVRKLKTKTRTYSMPTVTVTKAGGDEDGNEEDAQVEGEVEIASVEVNETTIEFELYDAQSALSLIGKHHGLFVDRTDINVSGSIDFTADEAAQAERELEEHRRRAKDAD